MLTAHSKTRSLLVAALCCLPCLTAPAAAQLPGAGVTFETENGFEATLLTPLSLDVTNRSGTAVSSDGSLYFVSRGTSNVGNANPNAGFFRSGDGGATWQRSSNSVGRTYNYADGLHVSPFDPQTVWVAEEKNNVLSVSRDGGRTFSKVDGTPRNLISLGFHPTEPDVIWAGGDLGLSETRDGGDTWQRTAPNDLPQGGTGSFAVATAIEVDPTYDPATDPDGPTVYVSYRNTSLGDRNGVYKSTDGGQSWQHKGRGLRVVGDSFTPADNLKLAPSDPQTMYSGVDRSTDNLLLRSTNGANNWQRLNLPDDPLQLSANSLSTNSITGVAIDPNDADRLVVATTHARLLLSEDGGDSWQDLGHLFADVEVLDEGGPDRNGEVRVTTVQGDTYTGTSPYIALGGLGYGGFVPEWDATGRDVVYVPTSFGLYSVAIPEPATGVAAVAVAGVLLRRVR